MKEETSPIPVSQEKLIKIAKVWDDKAKAHPELCDYGITPAFLTEFEGEITAAENFKTAEAVDKETAVITASKNAKNKECYKWIKTSLLYYEKIFPKKSSAERKLFPHDYSAAKANDTHTIAVMPDIFKLIDSNTEALTKKGMKAGFKENGTALLAGLEDIQRQHKKKMEDDELYTIQRRIALSKIYNKINEISHAGKLAHEDDATIGSYFDSPWPGGSKKAAPAAAQDDGANKEPAK